MKRTLAITLSTLALAAATGVEAQALALQQPQPSFVDHIPLQPGDLLDSSGGSTAIASTRRQEMPQPSFVDYVAIEAESWSAGTSYAGEISHNFPSPSFVDDRREVVSSPVAAQPMLAGSN